MPKAPVPEPFIEAMEASYWTFRDEGKSIKSHRRMLARLMDCLSAVLYIWASGRVHREPHHMKLKLADLAAWAWIAAEDLGYYTASRQSDK